MRDWRAVPESGIDLGFDAKALRWFAAVSCVQTSAICWFMGAATNALVVFPKGGGGFRHAREAAKVAEDTAAAPTDAAAKAACCLSPEELRRGIVTKHSAGGLHLVEKKK